MSEDISIVTEGRVTKLTITRPDKKNAITQAMYAAMADAVNAYAEDDRVRAFVITGSEGVFTSGNDLQDFSTGPANDEEMPPVARFLKAIHECPKPLIAGVNGLAIGVGLTMLLHCDLVFASESATFSAPFVKLGLVPEAASSMLLPQAVGMAVANDIFFTGRSLSADEALKFGLVSRVFADAELEQQLDEVAQLVGNSAPNAVRRTKKLVRYHADTVAGHMQAEGKAFVDQLKSPDFAESVAAMMQKRAPVFQ